MDDYKNLTAIHRIADLGGSGTGKSNTAYVIIREIRKKKHPTIILDTSDDYGDLAKTGLFKIYNAHKINGRSLAGKLRRTHQSAIVKFTRMKDLEDRRKWMSNFLEGCFEKKNRIPSLIVIDEAHNFIPQEFSKDPVQKKCKFMGNKLLSEGRKWGWGSLIVSQRAAKIDKNSLAECDRLIIHRHTLKKDQQTLDGYVGSFGIDAKKDIKELKIGEAFDLDVVNNSLEKYMMPLDRTKKLGRTPKARGVEPVKDTFWGRIKEMDIGLEANDVNIAIGTITVVSIILIIVAIAIHINQKEIIDTGLDEE